MKADLYTAQAGAAGAGGLAHRTAAGFVLLTSADGNDIIELIEEEQHNADLIDHVVAHAQSHGPSAFAMLFTASGDLYAIASGGARIALASPSALVTLLPAAGKVLVHQLSAAVTETAASVRLHVDDVSLDAIAEVELRAGTVDAAWVEVAIGAATVAISPATDDSPATSSDVDASDPTAAVDPDATADLPDAADVPIVSLDETDASDQMIDPADESSAAVDEPSAQEVETDIEIGPSSDRADPTDTPIVALDAGQPAAADIPFAPPIPAPAPAVTPEPAPAAEADVAPVATANVGAAMVLGVACPQGHHNHPDAVYCSQCGTKMGVHNTMVLTNGPRPPLGVLVVDDGTTYSLNQDLVIGREPTTHQDVIAGKATPMILVDDTLSLSRKHARIVLHDWSVFVHDLNSSNGTFLSRAGQDANWNQVESGATIALEPGDRVRVGSRVIQVELHHVR